MKHIDRWVVIVGIATCVLSAPAAAQQREKIVGEAVSAGRDTVASLSATAQQLRPELGKRLEALPDCVKSVKDLDAKLACLEAVRRVGADYFAAEIAVFQHWIDSDERELGELDQRTGA